MKYLVIEIEELKNTTNYNLLQYNLLQENVVNYL